MGERWEMYRRARGGGEEKGTEESTTSLRHVPFQGPVDAGNLIFSANTPIETKPDAGAVATNDKSRRTTATPHGRAPTPGCRFAPCATSVQRLDSLQSPAPAHAASAAPPPQFSRKSDVAAATPTVHLYCRSSGRPRVAARAASAHRLLLRKDRPHAPTTWQLRVLTGDTLATSHRLAQPPGPRCRAAVPGRH
eukprot:365126-Chlamydomonas_euryale.AAC.17